MRAVDIIIKKRNGGALDANEIDWFVQGFTRGDVPDYQAAAWAMAVLFQGMTPAETIALTEAMVRSGTQLDLSPIAAVVGDKHSTGGVGDKTTMVVAPLVAAAGLPIGKMSGRGLGYFGGTLDKLEAIPGMRITLSQDEFRDGLRKVGLVIAGQSADLAPADGKFYALRDVTGTVESIPLIASSIMSKKIAAGANVIVLDVKFGKGAFMKTLDMARALAEQMAIIGRGVGRNVRAVLSSMEQPLGLAVGNALEVAEAVETLKGNGPADLRDLCLTLGAQLLDMAGIAENTDAAREKLLRTLESGAAYEKFRAFVANQGGDVSVLDDITKLPCARCVTTLAAPRTAYVTAMDAEAIGIAAYTLGAGRAVKTDQIDPAVGLVLRAKVGDKAEVGAPLVEIHSANTDIDHVREALLAAYTFGDAPVAPPPLIETII